MVFLVVLTLTVTVSDLLFPKRRSVSERISGGVLSAEPKEFVFPVYMDSVKLSVVKKWEVPKERNKASAVAVFMINKDGSGSKDAARIVESSGDGSFSAAALNAVLAAYPFEPLPKEYKAKSVKIYFEFLCD